MTMCNVLESDLDNDPDHDHDHSDLDYELFRDHDNEHVLSLTTVNYLYTVDHNLSMSS